MVERHQCSTKVGILKKTEEVNIFHNKSSYVRGIKYVLYYANNIHEGMLLRSNFNCEEADTFVAFSKNKIHASITSELPKRKQS